MAYVVMCGPHNNAPDRIIGPFESGEAAAAYAETQPGMPERYAAVYPLDEPPSPRPVPVGTLASNPVSCASS
jgi:hypothetical protein